MKLNWFLIPIILYVLLLFIADNRRNKLKELCSKIDHTTASYFQFMLHHSQFQRESNFVIKITHNPIEYFHGFNYYAPQQVQ
jgi:hypothetical protein